MPNDIQDWTAAVNVQAGTVTIGSGTVSISGTPTVNINAGQSVAISGTPSVLISGTPNVSISGTPTVILGAGTASVGSVSAINSTVTVAGTINIGNTPAVSISGTPTVNISSGTVSISGTPSISIAGQSINVLTGSGQVFLGVPASGALGAAATTNIAIPNGVQAIVIDGGGAAPTGFSHLKVVGHVSNQVYYETFFFQSPVKIIAVFPVIYSRDASVDVTVESVPAGGSLAVALTGLLNSVPEFLEYYNPPWSRPNQIPISFGGVIIGNGGVQPIVSAVANETVFLFEARVFVSSGAAVPYDLEDSAGNVFWHGLTGDSPPSFHGVEFPIGRGISLRNSSGATQTMGGSAIYSRG